MNPTSEGGRNKRDGIRIVGRRGEPAVAEALIRYAAWLRRNYRFPVRVPVYLLPGEQFGTNSGNKCREVVLCAV